ncbi:hypothetical protein EIP91_011234 [Steccherinum ochraceum]|uniref:Uncharacterized protein n=1 Tax=Steccherinum ochraceum TaxID=92696 RepID=A0A4R0RWC0_9APHY|nr:hypothetical protein EIP91_011234 [Steccherinum ochraceum]
MTSPNGAPLYLATPGSPEYLQSILHKTGEIHPDLPLDPVILQSILLCLVAGRYHETYGQCSQTHARSKNLILRTKEEDVGMVLNIVAMILNTVFGFSTHKSKIKAPPIAKGSGRRYRAAQSAAQQHPEAFLRSLFFREPKPSPLIRELATERDRRDSGSKKSTRRPGKRSSTLASPIEHPHEGSYSAPPTVSHQTDTTDDSFLESSTLASSRRQLGTPASTMRNRPNVLRMQTEPSPLMSVFAPSLAAARPSSAGRGSHVSSNAVLPKALVMSGVEYANMPSQRALMQVLSERQLTLQGDQECQEPSGETWNLPEDFICVYVCSSDPHERPEILSGLVDKFSLSVEINVSSSTRLAYGSHRGSQASTPMSSPFQSPISLPAPRSPLNPTVNLPSNEPTPPTRTPFIRSGSSLPSHARSPSSTSPPVITFTDLAQLRALASPMPIAPPGADQTRYDMITQFAQAHTSIHPSLNAYLSDLFSATRHHPELDGSLLTLQARRDADDLVRAFRVIGGDTLGTELVETSANRAPSLRHTSSTDSYDRVSRMDVESIGWSKEDRDILMSFESPHPEVRVQEPEPDTPRPNGNGHFTPAQFGSDSQTRAASSLPLPPAEEVWDVSEVDIARIFPRVVSHRLSVRRGPDDEILGGVMFPAVPHDMQRLEARTSVVMVGEQPSPFTRRTVKEVLVGILADV